MHTYIQPVQQPTSNKGIACRYCHKKTQSTIQYGELVSDKLITHTIVKCSCNKAMNITRGCHRCGGTNNVRPLHCWDDVHRQLPELRIDVELVCDCIERYLGVKNIGTSRGVSDVLIFKSNNITGIVLQIFGCTKCRKGIRTHNSCTYCAGVSPNNVSLCFYYVKFICHNCNGSTVEDGTCCGCSRVCRDVVGLNTRSLYAYTCGAEACTNISKDLVRVIDEDDRGLRKCKKCDKRLDTPLLCGRCGLVAYCNNECQKIDWSRHKTECS